MMLRSGGKFNTPQKVSLIKSKTDASSVPSIVPSIVPSSVPSRNALNENDFEKWLTDQSVNSTSSVSGGGCPRREYDVAYDKQLEDAIKASLKSVNTRPEDPLRAKDCVVSQHNFLSSSSLKEEDKKCINIYIPRSITDDNTTKHMIVRGNGFCFFNSMICLLMQTFPQVEEWNYPNILDIIRSLLLEENFIDPNPSVIDEKLVRIVMRKFLNLMGMNQVTFAIIALDEGTLNVDFAENPNPADTFIILYKGGHFNALYCIESNRIQVYHMISIFMAS